MLEHRFEKTIHIHMTDLLSVTSVYCKSFQLSPLFYDRNGIQLHT